MKNLIVDGHNLIFRVYYSAQTFKDRINMFDTFIKYFKDKWGLDDVYVVFDSGKKSENSTLLEQYKQNRNIPDDFKEFIVEFLKVQIPKWNAIVKDGIEADDVIATIASKYSNQYEKTYILSNDKDLWQLVDDKINIFSIVTGLRNYNVVDEKFIYDKYGIAPSEMIMFKAIMGDPSDNIPGIQKCGEKTALTLVKKFGNLDNLYQWIDEGKNLKDLNLRGADTIYKNIVEYRDDAYLYEKIVRLNKDLQLFDTQATQEIEL